MTPINNLVIRKAEHRDLEQLLFLSEKTGSGMTSMPTDKKTWEYKLERSVEDFSRQVPSKNGDVYFLVMEDQQSGNLVGSGAFCVGIGLKRPFYSYKVAAITTSSEKLDLTVHTRILHLVNDYRGATEIGSLFLLPEYRRDGIGKFLSRARFLLLADFPERFSEKVFAEMRGWIDSNGQSPFWESLGRKFFGLSFEKADFINAVDGSQFISDLMPKYPVYLDLLPKEAQQVVGKPNDATIGALRILENEGFKYNEYVDIFDAGPSVDAQMTDIKTVSESSIASIGQLLLDDAAQLAAADHYIVSNGALSNYRMMRIPLVTLEDKTLAISDSAAKTLAVEKGDSIRFVLA